MKNSVGHGYGSGTIKSEIINLIINGTNTREGLKWSMKGKVSNKDVDYHLSKSGKFSLLSSGAVYEKNGTLYVNTRDFDRIVDALNILTRQKKYREGLDLAFAECFFSGYVGAGFSVAHSPSFQDYSEAFGFLQIWHSQLIKNGVRYPICNGDLTSLFILKASESFLDARSPDEERLKLKIAYLVNVLMLKEYLENNVNISVGNLEINRQSNESIIEIAKNEKKFSKLCWRKIISIANGKETSFLGEVSKVESELINLSVNIGYIGYMTLEEAVASTELITRMVQGPMSRINAYTSKIPENINDFYNAFSDSTRELIEKLKKESGPLK